MEPYLIPSYLQYVKLMPKMIKKRKVIMKIKKLQQRNEKILPKLNQRILINNPQGPS